MKNEVFKLSSLILEISETPPLMFGSFTDPLNAPAGEPWDSIRECYASKSPGVRALGMIINGAATNKKTTFLFSRKIHNDWLKMHYFQLGHDVSGQVYSKILAQLLDTKHGIIRCIQPWASKNGNDRRAGIYEIIRPELLEQIKNAEVPEEEANDGCDINF
jgi:hypothetical protein